MATRAQAAEQLCKTCIRNHPTDITVPEIDGGARGPSGSAEASSSSAVIYGTGAVRSAIKKRKISKEKFLALIQLNPPLCVRKISGKKGIAAPSEIRKVAKSPIEWRPEPKAALDSPDIRTRFGLAEGESISRWCCAQARAKDLLHTQRSQPFDAAPE